MAFFNIFPKKEKKVEKPKIVIDYREKNSMLPAELAHLGAEIEFKHLPVGDYLVNGAAIERKTVSDLKNSIINKRLISQLLELKQFPTRMLLIEGINEDMYFGGIHENALRGFILAVVLEYGVPVICTLDEKDSAKYIFVLAKKREKSEQALRASKIALSKDEQAQYILEGFPRIGPKSAQQLLEHFKTLRRVFNASEEELSHLLGKKGKGIVEILEHEFKGSKKGKL